MKNKEKAFTLMEIMVAVAILVIIISMLVPLFNSITKSNKATQDTNNLDLNVGKTIEIYKRAVRNSKSFSTTFGGITGVGIYLADNNGDKVSGTTARAIVINVPKESTTTSGSFLDEKVIFYYNTTEQALYINSTTTTSGNFSSVTGETLLVTDVLNAEFGYQQKIATIYLKVQTDNNNSNKFKEIKDAAVTRINMDF